MHGMYSPDISHEIYENIAYERKELPIIYDLPFQSKLSSRLKRGRMNEMLVKLNHQSKNMTNQYLSGPSIPAKNQKILKTSPHAQKVNDFLQNGMRYRHKREKSFQHNLSDTFNKDDMSYISKSVRPSSILKQKRKGFATSSHRFDKKKDFERLFDSTPGPGTYNLSQHLEEKAKKLMNYTQ